MRHWSKRFRFIQLWHIVNFWTHFREYIEPNRKVHRNHFALLVYSIETFDVVSNRTETLTFRGSWALDFLTGVAEYAPRSSSTIIYYLILVSAFILASITFGMFVWWFYWIGECLMRSEIEQKPSWKCMKYFARHLFGEKWIEINVRLVLWLAFGCKTDDNP